MLNLKMEKMLANVTMESVKELVEVLNTHKFESLDERDLNIYRKAIAYAMSEYKDIFKLDNSTQWEYMTLGYLFNTVNEEYCSELQHEVLVANSEF